MDITGKVLIKKNYSSVSSVVNFIWNGSINGIQCEPGIYFIKIESQPIHSGKKEQIIRKLYIVK